MFATFFFQPLLFYLLLLFLFLFLLGIRGTYPRRDRENMHTPQKGPLADPTLGCGHKPTAPTASPTSNTGHSSCQVQRYPKLRHRSTLIVLLHLLKNIKVFNEFEPVTVAQ